MNSYIKLNNVSLDYILNTGAGSIRKFAYYSLQKILGKKVDTAYQNTTFRALNNINLNIKPGDKIGILGRNGAGKSSLLRVLAGIYKPNQGTVVTHGKSSCLFDISLGLDPEASGIENIITMCIIKGMTRAEAINIIDDVAEFTELGDFLHKPVRMYSSGMSMKLAFGVATAGHPEILLVDEVIGVGDGKFMEKATNRIQDLMHQCEILVLTTHSNKLIKQFCNSAIVLDHGNIIFHGDVDEAIEKYDALLFNDSQQHQIAQNQTVTQENLETESV